MRFETFGVDDGLPSAADVSVQRAGGEIVFGTRQGIYRFDEEAERFERHPRFANLFGGAPRSVSKLRDGRDSRIWISTWLQTSALLEAAVMEGPESNDAYSLDPQPLRDLAGADVGDILVEDDGVVWVGSSEGLFRLDSTKTRNYDQHYRALVRRVRLAGGGADLYGGNGEIDSPRLEYADNGLRFEYAAPYFSGGSPQQFQVFLEGNDDGWSEWTSETYREYTNLHEGRYRFRVRAKNAYDTLSEEAIYSFDVLPPWYRTIWAYVAYLLGASLLTWGLVRWRVERVRVEKRALEDVVAASIAELEGKNEQLETLASIVKSINETMDLDALLNVMLFECRVIPGVERAAALVREGDSTNFVLRATFNWSVEGKLTFPGVDDRLSDNFTDYWQPVAKDIKLVRGEPPWPPEAREAGVAAPAVRLNLFIRVEGRIDGTLIFANDRDPDAFRDANTELLQGLKEHFVSAFQKARAHQTAEQARARAEEANRAKSDFLANMSHELRTPLNSILGFAQLMERQPGRIDEDRRRLRRILGSGEHLLRLINDVLSLSKIEAGHLQIEQAPFDHLDLLRSLEVVIGPLCEGKGLELRFVVEPGWPSVVLGDEGRLRQILLNLLGNAAKFASEGGVTLAARWAEDRASFAVTDTGPGIPAEEQALLFEAFSQTSLGRKTKEGTGLGLALSRQLARAMGGDVTMVSLPGRGSTFTAEVELPAAPSGAEIDARERRRVIGLVPGQAPPRILVVDDSEDSRDLLSGFLRNAGFEVRTAPDGRRGVDAWRTWRPDLIWMDQRMPGMDGTEATREIRAAERAEDRARVPILAVSASALDHERESLRAAGCDDFVPKPFTAETIFSKIAEYLEVRYVYEEHRPLRTSDSASNAKVLGLLLEEAPRDWLAGFEKALSLGEVQKATRMTETLDDQDLAEALRTMLGAFQLDELETALWNALGQTRDGRTIQDP